MKKITLLTILLYSIICYSQDTIFVYQENSLIKIAGLEDNPVYINPASATIFLVRDNINIHDGNFKNLYDLGTYDKIFNVDTIGFASKTAVLEYLSMFTGVHETQYEFGYANNLDTTLNSVYEISKNGYNTMAFRLIPPGGGTISFEASFDGTNYEVITFRSITEDILVNTADDTCNILGSISGVQKFRFRTSSAGTGTLGTVMGAMTKQVSVLENIEFFPPPHRFGYLPVIKTVNLTDSDTVTAWLPASGKTFSVTDLSVLAGGNTDATVQIFSTIDTVFNTAIDVSNNRQFIYTKSYKTPWLGRAANDSIVINSSAGIDINITIVGYEY